MNTQPKIELFKKLNHFITRFYMNQLIKGVIYCLAVLTIFFIVFSIAEYFTKFDVVIRTLLFWAYFFINLLIAVKYLFIPALRLFSFGEILTHKQAAKIIGDHFSEIGDKLLNILELEDMSESDNELINASIQQKIKTIQPIVFSNAINYSENKKYIKWILIPIAIILLFIISGKQYILTESSARILKHNTFFEPKAPFEYVLLNPKLEAIQYDDYIIKIKLVGNEIPNEVFIKSEQNIFKLTSLGNNTFEYEFTHINTDIIFTFFAGGYNSRPYTIQCLTQPKVVSLKIAISHPRHTKKGIEKIINTGDIIISEGSTVSWDISFKNSNYCYFIIKNDTIAETTNNQLLVQQQLFKNSSYSIVSTNKNNLIDTLTYSITVNPDNYPKINLEQIYDSTTQRYIFNGEITDDYLLTKLDFCYSYNTADSNFTTSKNILIQGRSSERFFYTFSFEELNLNEAEEISYYFKVWDNDNINGSKFTKSTSFNYKAPSLHDLIKKKDLENEKTKKGLNKSVSLAEEIQKEIEKLTTAIIEKKKIGWEEKQKAKNILKKQKELEKQISDTKKKNSENLKTKEKLNSATLNKQKQLEKLMNQAFDKEMKELLNEMREMMDEINKEKLKTLLEKLDEENTNLEKELDRELELFKQLEFEQKIEEALDKIAKLKRGQEKLKRQTETDTLKREELAKKQEALKKEMKEIKKDLQNLRKKNMALEEKNALPNTKANEEDIKQKMQESKEALQKGKKNKAKKAQEETLKKLDKLEKQLQSIQQSCGKEKSIEDMETLRKILENLVSLSFDQEKLMAHAKETPKNSAEFIKIIQQQNKLADDSQIIEDSLLALSKRVVQIQAAINKEIATINHNMNKATQDFEERKTEKASERQQFVMTSANNLALLLSEILEEMQKDSPSKCNKPSNCNKPNPNCDKPSMLQLKEAQKRLNKQMKAEKNCKKEGGQKRGEEQSKKLMQLAKQQEEIRKQLMSLRDQVSENGEKGKLDKILEYMEENERDIINNKITEETINRQKEILSKLLEAENAKRDQEQDKKRTATEWQFELENTTKEYLEYKKQKEAQEELLKTTPIKLTPFYKKKVNNYFKAITND